MLNSSITGFCELKRKKREEDKVNACIKGFHPSSHFSKIYSLLVSIMLLARSIKRMEYCCQCAAFVHQLSVCYSDLGTILQPTIIFAITTTFFFTRVNIVSRFSFIWLYLPKKTYFFCTKSYIEQLFCCWYTLIAYGMFESIDCVFNMTFLFFFIQFPPTC